MDNIKKWVAYGSGSGYGDGFKLGKDMVYNIDDVPTVIKSIKGNVARGYIVNDDLTMNKTYVVKDEKNKYFAHGKTIKKAAEALQNKIIADMDTEELIDMFLCEVDINKQYPASYFFNWHGKLTGSCLQGRESFVKNKRIDLTKNMTLGEFLEITKHEYGGEIIEQIIEKIEGRD